jgi:Protein of unknown function (DUF3054)
MRSAGAALADLGCVLLFVVIGRANHHAGGGLAGLWDTAWPFVAGLAVGLVATRYWQRPAALVPVGVGVWLCTVAIGMLLRVVSGQGTAFAFVLVALAFLGLFQLGWRAAVSLAPRARSRVRSRARASTPG